MGIDRFRDLFIALQLVLGLLVFPMVATAADSESPGVRDRVLNALKSDIYRFSVSSARTTLHNPEGFDVSSSTYADGKPETDGLFNLDGGQFSWTLTGETANGWEGRRKRLWRLHFDSEEFDGLKLQNLMVGAGFAIDPANRFALGGRLAGGLGTGLTRSSTYFDSAIHLAIEAWVSTGIQLGRFTLDFSVRERKALSASLDARSAAPATRVAALSVGWLF